MAWYFGETAATNNEAEAEALLRTLQWLDTYNIQERCVIIKGDTFLVIQFMNKLCMPRVNSLVERVSTCQEIRRRLGVPVHVIHVPREMNQLADWLSRCGTAYGRDVSLAELAMNFEETCAPPK
jgi:ribonuclease HI